MTPPRPDVSEERRNQILDVAERVFAKHGLADARMDDIAADAGLSKGAVYWYFRKKDDLIAALLERVFRRNLAAVERIVDSKQDSMQSLRAVARRIAEDYRGLTRLAPIAVDFYALALRNRAVRTFISRMYARYAELLRTILAGGVASKQLRADLDVDATIATFLAVFEGMGLMWAVERTIVDWNHTPAVAVELLIEGMRR